MLFLMVLLLYVPWDVRADRNGFWSVTEYAILAMYGLELTLSWQLFTDSGTNTRIGIQLFLLSAMVAEKTLSMWISFQR